jgi:hypothetical protein
MANIPEALLSYRIHDEQVTKKQIMLMGDSSNRIRARLLREMGATPSMEELKIHEFLGSPRAFLAAVADMNDLKSRLVAVDKWLCKLSAINALSRTYPEPLFSRILLWRWMILWHLVFAQYGIRALSALRGVRLQKVTKGGWMGLVPILRSKGVALLEEIRHQKKVSRYEKEVKPPRERGVF